MSKRTSKIKEGRVKFSKQLETQLSEKILRKPSGTILVGFQRFAKERRMILE